MPPTHSLTMRKRPIEAFSFPFPAQGDGTGLDASSRSRNRFEPYTWSLAITGIDQLNASVIQGTQQGVDGDLMSVHVAPRRLQALDGRFGQLGRKRQILSFPAQKRAGSAKLFAGEQMQASQFYPVWDKSIPYGVDSRPEAR